MIISRSALIVSVLVGASVGIGGITMNILVKHEEPSVPPAPQIVQPEIDEERIADLVAGKMIAAADARVAAERTKHKKADCAFWGKRMEGCS